MEGKAGGYQQVMTQEHCCGIKHSLYHSTSNIERLGQGHGTALGVENEQCKFKSRERARLTTARKARTEQVQPVRRPARQSVVVKLILGFVRHGRWCVKEREVNIVKIISQQEHDKREKGESDFWICDERSGETSK
jgi:hypothetical protein